MLELSRIKVEHLSGVADCRVPPVDTVIGMVLDKYIQEAGASSANSHLDTKPSKGKTAKQSICDCLKYRTNTHNTLPQ